MTGLTDAWLMPALVALGIWSLRWAVIIVLIALGLALIRPKSVAARLFLCQLVFFGGLLLPLLPRYWGPTVATAPARPMVETHGTEMVSRPATPPAASAETAGPVSAPEHAKPSTRPAPPADATQTPPEPAAVKLPGTQMLAATLMLAWLGGVTLLIIRLVLGWMWLSRLRRSAQPAGPTSQELLDQCRNELAIRRQATLLQHAGVRGPILLGGRRPAIIVPTGWDALSVDCRRAVLVHELTHVAYRDDWARAIEEIVRAFFFFHPLVHWLLNRLDGEREGRCDAAVVRRGTAPRQLAEVLLDFAGRQGPGGSLRIPGTALPFFKQMTLKRRIEQLLAEEATSWAGPLSSARKTGLGVAALAFMVAVGGFGLRSAPPEKAPAEPPPSAGAPAARPATSPARVTLRGTVSTKDDKPVRGALVKIVSAEPRTGPAILCPSCYLDCAKSARSNEHGQFEIADLEPTLKFVVLVTAPGKRARQSKLFDPVAKEARIVLDALPPHVRPERTVLGEVVNDGGQAVAGAFIEPCGAENDTGRWLGNARDVDPALSDAAGRFNLLLPDGCLGVNFEITAPGYAGVRACDPRRGPFLKPGAALHRIVLPYGTRVTGRLVHKGQAMPGLHVAVVQADRDAARYFIGAIGDVTDRDGRFAFDHLPPNAQYAIFSVVGGGPEKYVVATRRFTAYGNHQDRSLGDLSVIPARRLAGRVEAGPDQTLPADIKVALARDLAWDPIVVPVARDGRFVVDGLPPEVYKVDVIATGLTIDTARIPYQALSRRSFGLRLRESVEDLQIPLMKYEPSNDEP